jgi:hypothetical protein
LAATPLFFAEALPEPHADNSGAAAIAPPRAAEVLNTWRREKPFELAMEPSIETCAREFLSTVEALQRCVEVKSASGSAQE